MAQPQLVLHINWEGVDYVYDPTRLSVLDAKKIKQYAGLTYAGLTKAWAEGDPEALQCVLWFIKKEAGEQVGDISKLNFSVGDFYQAISDAVEEWQASLDEPLPKPAE
jgi:hypothetical protein